ncbi:MAG: hypothetical protein NZN28_11930 [Meiothermus sp.]|uniref:hypothetical protein n=1 Tax=Meiothermus sp. TaxID=1955249 RepID=UPI0025D65A31|nr:hypothetical protein [Meiothermus sp.]MCS7069321.1 hypothetical protein [Meiothermus sp.]
MAHRALFDNPPNEWRWHSFSPEAVRWARLALEMEGYEVQSSADLLEHGALLAAWHPQRQQGYLLSPSEVHLVARYGPEYLRGGLVGYVKSHSHQDDPGHRIRRYAEAALARIVAGFQAEAREGNRNNALNRMAYQLGRLVGGEIISEGEARELVLGQAQTVGVGGKEAERTLRSGLEAGKRKPASKPEQALGLKPRKGVVPPWAK